MPGFLELTRLIFNGFDAVIMRIVIAFKVSKLFLQVLDGDKILAKIFTCKLTLKFAEPKFDIFDITIEELFLVGFVEFRAFKGSGLNKFFPKLFNFTKSVLKITQFYMFSNFY